MYLSICFYERLNGRGTQIRFYLPIPINYSYDSKNEQNCFRVHAKTGVIPCGNSEFFACFKEQRRICFAGYFRNMAENYLKNIFRQHVSF